MEIKKIDPYTFENFDKYMLVMPIDSIDEVDNYYFLETDGKQYVIGEKGNKMAFAEKDNGMLTPYKVELDKCGEMEKLSTEENNYTFKRDGCDTFVQQENNLNGNVKSLAFIKKDEVDSYLELRHYIEEYSAMLVQRYQTLHNSTNASSAILYTNFHLPTHLEIHEICGNRLFSYGRTKFFYLTKNPKIYRRAYIVTKNSYHLSSIQGYDGEKLMNLINEIYGFPRGVDSTLASFVSGKNEEYNKMRKLVDSYQNYILGHK